MNLSQCTAAELGEVQAALGALPQVTAAAVIAVADSGGGRGALFMD